MDSVIQDLVSNKCSASKVRLLNNFLKQWSRIDREEKKRNEIFIEKELEEVMNKSMKELKETLIKEWNKIKENILSPE